MTTPIGTSNIFQAAQAGKQQVLEAMKAAAPKQADGSPAQTISRETWEAQAKEQLGIQNPQDADKVFDQFAHDQQKGLTDQEAEAALNSVLEGGLAQGVGMNGQDANPAVAVLQNQLNNIPSAQGGTADSPIEEDGMFGPQTAAALSAFQQANGIPDTGGVIDDATAAKLQDASGVSAPVDPAAQQAQAAPAPATPAPPPPLGAVADGPLGKPDNADLASKLPDPNNPAFQPPTGAAFNNALQQAVQTLHPNDFTANDMKALASYYHMAGDDNRARACNLMSQQDKFSPEVKKAVLDTLQHPEKGSQEVRDAIFGDRKNKTVSDEELTAAGLAANAANDPNLGNMLTAVGTPGVTPEVRKQLLFSLDDDGNKGDFNGASDAAANANPPMSQADVAALQQAANWQVGRNNKDKDFFASAAGTLNVVNANYATLAANPGLLKQLGSIAQADSPQHFAEWLTDAAGAANTPQEQAALLQVAQAGKDRGGEDLAPTLGSIFAIPDPGQRQAMASQLRHGREAQDQLAEQKKNGG